MKQRYLAVYDYGMGGLWCYINAESPEQIQEKYPELKIFTKEPEWMSAEEKMNIAKKLSCDIEKPPTGWLLKLLELREINKK